MTSEVRAQRRIYRLERAPLAELDAWLERFRPLPGRGALDRSGTTPLVPPSLANRLDALHVAAGRATGATTATPAVLEALADNLDITRAIDLAIEAGGPAARDLVQVLAL